MFGRLRQRRWGLIAGAAVSLAGSGLFLTGATRRLEELGFDLHVRYFSSIPADPRIVLVDIDDQAIRAAPWPWPRRIVAELVRTLDELGAASVVLDLVLDEPSTPRHDHPALRDVDIDPLLSRAGDLRDDPVVYDDRELAAAIAAAGNVYLAMFFEMAGPGDAEAGRHPSTVAREDRDQFSRVVQAVASDFGLDAAGVAAKLGVSSAAGLRSVERLLPPAKRWVARDKARQFLAERPAGSFREFFSSVLTEASLDVLTADRADLADAFRRADAERVVLAKSSWPANNRKGLPFAWDGTLPLAPFASAADGVGMVSFSASTAGGTVRALPLAALADDQRAVLQLGLLPALEVEDAAPVRIDADSQRLNIGAGPRGVRLPLNRHGESLIHWHVADSGRWEDSFRHVPAGRILEIVNLRDSIEQNDSRLGLLYGELMSLRHEETPAEYARYVEAVRARRELRKKHQAANTPPGATAAAEIERLSALIEESHAEALVWLTRVQGLWQQTTPQTPAEHEAADRVRSLHERLVEADAANTARSTNDKLAGRIRELSEALRPALAEKLCFVGYTASAMADLVTTPAYPAMPGVLAHANVCNMVLQNRPLRPVDRSTDAGLFLAAGLLMALATILRGPISSVLSLAVLTVCVLWFGVYAFHQHDRVVASVPVAANTALVWAVVTAYRQLTEERARRNFERALRQYTSPAIAAQIAENLDASALAPRPAMVTCFYADLAGFTRLSAELGPERTRLVLNPYLAMLTRVLTHEGALVNKFTGDGVFAFFNAPILPCPEHAAAACRAAIASRDALDELNRQPGATRLRMRVGLASGTVFVGDFGSDTKLDYTCLGDAVNLGSRLETAGKHLGTGILVDEATARLAGSAFSFRRLGRFELPGFAGPVTVVELLGASDHLDHQQRGFLDCFAGMVAAFQGCQWDRCREAIQQCAALRPDDAATRLYARELDRRANGLSGGDNLAIRLGPV